MSAKIPRRTMIKRSMASALAAALPGTAAAKGRSAPKGRLAGQVALITGSARGLGRAIAVAMANEGARITSLDIQPAPETERMVRAVGSECLTVRADVRNGTRLREAVKATLDRFGRLDILVANAAIQGPNVPIHESKEDDWARVIDVNLNGVAGSILAVTRPMIERQDGKIVVISSLSGRIGHKGSSAYISSKWAVIGLAKCAALDLGKHGIRVNTICPSGMRSPITEKLYQVGGENETHIRSVPLVQKGRAVPGLLEHEEVAACAVFLASEEGRGISGAVLDIQLGKTALNLC